MYLTLSSLLPCFFTTVFSHPFHFPSLCQVFYCFSTPSFTFAKKKKKKKWRNAYTIADKPWITYDTISLLAIMDMGWGESLLPLPYIYNINVDRRPIGQVQLLLEVYILPNTEAVTHGCSLGDITTTIINTMMILLTIILFLM